MAPDDERLIRAFAGKGVLLDSNLLLLLVVGTYDRAQVGRYKRLAIFAPDDFDILVALVAHFRHVYITPNVATEVSNLAGGFSGRAREQCFKVLAASLIAAEEIAVPTRAAASHFAFNGLGLTDAALFLVAGEPPLVLTVDFPLSQRLAA